MGYFYILDSFTLVVMVTNYHNLEIFHLSYQLVLKLYPVLNLFPSSENGNLVIQMKRSAISIPFNIAEGSSRKTVREFLPFLGYAFGSAKELEVAFNLSKDLGFMETQKYTPLYEDLQILISKLVLFVRDLELKVPPKKEIVMTQVSRGENPWHNSRQNILKR